MIASSSGWTPLFLKAEPHSTGVIAMVRVASADGAPQVGGIDLAAFEIRLHELVVVVGDRLEQVMAVLRGQLARSSGMATVSHSVPSSSTQTRAFISTRSTMPRNSASLPIGSCRATGLAPRRSTIISTPRKKSAPMRSILLMKAMRGMPYLSAWRHTVSDCGSTPPTEQNRAMAPSRTRRLRSTSTVKSTWPGVSMMLIW